MNTLAYVMILVAGLLVRGMTRGRSLTQLPGDLGDGFIALVRNDQAALKEVFARTGDALTPTTSATPAGSTAPPVAGSPGVADPKGEAHLTGNTVAVRRAVLAAFPGLTVGGYRTGPDAQDHAKGKAIDVMVSDAAKGGAVSGFVHDAATSPRFTLTGGLAGGGAWGSKVQYIIWNQHIWNVDRAAEGWRAMTDRGSATANHLDHVHVSVK